MAHAQETDFVFRGNGRVHLNGRGRQFSRLLAAEVCASAVVMLDTPCSEVVWRVLAIHSIRQFPLHFPSLRHRVTSHFNWSLKEGKGAHIYATKAYMSSGGSVPTIFNEGSTWRRVVSLTLRQIFPSRSFPVTYCVDPTADLDVMRDKSLAPTEIRTSDLQARSLVTTLITLSSSSHR